MRLLFSRKFILFFIPYLFLYLLTAHNALFWDTMQFAGDHPNWYYDHHFHYLLLPDYCDSGHPPTFGMYLALSWELFGKSLWISHTAMLPFIILLVAQAVRTGDLLFPRSSRSASWLTLLILSESVLLTQCTLVSPDIWVMAFFLLGLNAVLRRSRGQLVLAVCLMGMLSTRAMMVSVTLYLFALSYNRALAGHGLKGKLQYALRQVLSFLPGALLAITYFVWHYLGKGWIGYPKNSPWSGGFEIMPLPRIGLNVLILGWRIIDLGKIATALVFGIMLLLWWRRKIVFNGEQKATAQSLFVLFLALFFITALPLSLYQGLLTHRYFLPLTTCIAIIAAYFLLQSAVRYREIVIFVMVLVQFSGHFWNYPLTVSQGWEGTLGHLYFYDMRRDFRDYMAQQGIRKEEVASGSTMMQADKRIDLTDDTTAYKDFEKDSTKYVWYCNVSNSMNKTAPYYFRNFAIVKQERKGNVIMVLFRRPGY